MLYVRGNVPRMMRSFRSQESVAPLHFLGKEISHIPLLSEVSRPKEASLRITAGYIIRGTLSKMEVTGFSERSGENEGATFWTTFADMRSCDQLEKFGLRLCKSRTSYPLLYTPTTERRRGSVVER